ncbi:hypothetical protein DIPPA_10280 [Diplonema papillatum]|nr:hypothetical protein DIPPA_10280 [Diplonema papillatum]
MVSLPGGSEEEGGPAGLPRIELPCLIHVRPMRFVANEISVLHVPRWKVDGRDVLLAGCESGDVVEYRVGRKDVEDELVARKRFGCFAGAVSAVDSDGDAAVFATGLDGLLKEWTAAGTAEKVYDTADEGAALGLLMYPDGYLHCEQAEH